MTAQIIKLSDRREARERAKFESMMWPYVASIGFWEAYLAVMQSLWQISKELDE